VFKILKRLIPNPFEIAASIMNVDSKWLCTIEINLLVGFYYPDFLLAGIYIFPFEYDSRK
jgi:hypothetical protein